MASIPMEIERDPKDSLRFFATIPDQALPPSALPALSLDIAEADKLAAAVKKRRATEGGRVIAGGAVGVWLTKHVAGTAGLQEHSVYRKKAGNFAAHWRVGLSITFANAPLAQAFATAFNVR